MPGRALRSALEPLTPAFVGVGLAHLLFGLVIWTLLPWVASEDDTPDSGGGKAEPVWRAPADFREVPLESPGPVAPAGREEKSPAKQAEVKPPAVKLPEPVQPKGSDALQARSSAPRGAAQSAPALVGGNDSISSATGMDMFLLRPVAAGLRSQIDGLDGGGRGGAEHGSTVHLQVPPSTSGGMGRPLREPAKYIAISAISKAAPPALVVAPQAVPSLLQVAVHNEADRLLAAETGGADMGAVERALQQAMLEAWKPPSPTLVPADRRRVEVRLAVLRDGAIRDAVIHRESGSQDLDDSVRQMLQKVTKISESLPIKFPGTRYSLQVNLQID